MFSAAPVKFYSNTIIKHNILDILRQDIFFGDWYGPLNYVQVILQHACNGRHCAQHNLTTHNFIGGKVYLCSIALSLGNSWNIPFSSRSSTFILPVRKQLREVPFYFITGLNQGCTIKGRIITQFCNALKRLNIIKFQTQLKVQWHQKKYGIYI